MSHICVSWGLKHRIAHGVHGHEFMTSHHVHMTRHELMSNTPLKIWMEAVGQEAREGLNTELDLEKPAQPTYGTFFATYGTFGNLWHFLARV